MNKLIMLGLICVLNVLPVSAQLNKDELKQSVIEAFSVYREAFAAAANEIGEVEVKFQFAKIYIITDKEALEYYNAKFGEIIGRARTLDAAKKLLQTKGIAYMEAKALSAIGEELRRMGNEY